MVAVALIPVAFLPLVRAARDPFRVPVAVVPVAKRVVVVTVTVAALVVPATRSSSGFRRLIRGSFSEPSTDFSDL